LGKKTILIVDSDPAVTWDLCEALTRAGHTVTDTAKAEHALEILDDRSFRVAILDVLSSRVGDIDLIDRLRKSWTNPLIIAMSDFEVPAVKKSIISRGADHFVCKPLDMEQLLALISPAQAFSGRVQGVDILEYIQFMLLTGNKTVVEVRSQEGRCCRIFMHSGNVLHAVIGDITGDEAFHQCIQFEGGTFSHLPWTEPEQRTIMKPGELLLIEAARLKDER